MIKRKVKLVWVVAAVATALGTSYGMMNENEEWETNSLMLENVEALANGEVSGPIRCYGRGTVDCPFNHTKVEFVYQGL